jgi:hypothetical protein
VTQLITAKLTETFTMTTLNSSTDANNLLINLLAKTGLGNGFDSLPKTCDNLEVKLDCSAMQLDNGLSQSYKLGMLQTMYVNLVGKAQSLCSVVKELSANAADTKGRLALILGLADNVTTGRAEAMADLFEANPESREAMDILFRDYQKAQDLDDQRQMQAQYNEACEADERQAA